MNRYLTVFAGLFAGVFFCSSSYAKESWDGFLDGIRQEALQQGIRPAVVNEAFNWLSAPNSSVLRFDRAQPERRITYIKYRNTRADEFRISLGRNEMRKHKAILTQVAQRYDVNACFIVSLWGLETSYGRYMGTFPVIHSLTTLAYDDRRSDFFRNELFIALHILDEGHVRLKDFKGEWAGASGHSQFLPSSWRDYAVDDDGDGHKDIWKSLPDAFASIANYLHKNGWRRGEPWTVPVAIPAGLDKDLLSVDVTKSVAQWQRLGVRVDDNLPGNMQASIVQPDGGPAMMVFNNFKVIMKWNRSTYYAGTVGYMADRICQ
jgi:membrane-bound lytic murein transglycosylase B